MSFACIFVPDFPMEAILRAEPELRSQDVAVLEGKPPLQKIIAVNEAARKAGITPGMTKLQIEGCGGIALRDRSELQESAAHQALLDCSQSFSPRVEDFAPDTVLLDLSGLDKLFGPLPAIAREIFRRTWRIGLRTNVSVAGTLDAALLAAHGFSEVTVLPKGKESEVLGSLPVEVLFADESDSKDDDKEEVLETFRQWGIRKFGDLAALPGVALSERLGQRGLELQRKACGRRNRTLVPSDPPLLFEEAMELEFPLVLLEPLAFLLSRMLDQLCARLQSRSLAAQEIHLEMTLENGRRDSGNTFQRAIHLPVPLLNAQTFLKLLQLDLKAHPPGAPIVKVHLHIVPAKPRPGQAGLFIPCSPEPEKLELTLARISAVVGQGRAGSPKLLDTHRPQAFEMLRFMPAASENVGFGRARTPVSPRNNNFGGTGILARVEKNLENGNHTAINLVTALRILRPPIPVTVNQQEGKPSHISSDKRNQITGEVVWAAGPWRSSGDWWEEDAWVRDEWDIAVQEKIGIVLYRLIHDLIDGRWLLEGSYD